MVDVLVVGGEGGGGGGDEKRKRVMRSMAHLWLEQEVRDLEGQLGQAGRQAAPPPFLVPHTQGAVPNPRVLPPPGEAVPPRGAPS
ncbi:hypothetical protein HPB52_007340 [Rhipicephalus sanguineus]|uniref:Uncharacterized protein n=1 Tax=Rhipicephalus sanguineus TaxID=34632 RepID=A0A9D4PV91_RHISA|nr:hypothetical protein HPB52_007340 [Rhipicephalus sanguineus]